MVADVFAKVTDGWPRANSITNIILILKAVFKPCNISKMGVQTTFDKITDVLHD